MILNYNISLHSISSRPCDVGCIVDDSLEIVGNKNIEYRYSIHLLKIFISRHNRLNVML